MVRYGSGLHCDDMPTSRLDDGFWSRNWAAPIVRLVADQRFIDASRCIVSIRATIDLYVVEVLS